MKWNILLALTGKVVIILSGEPLKSVDCLGVLFSLFLKNSL